MLILVFQLGNQRYALEAQRVVEVVPLVSLTKIAHAPKGVAGMFVYRGRAVPAVDLCELTIGQPARERLSTRIIIIDHSDAYEEVLRARGQVSGEPDTSHLTPVTPCGMNPPAAPEPLRAVALSEPEAHAEPSRPSPPLVGLIVERATGTIRREARDFVDAVPRGAANSAPFLGPVLIDDRGVIQLLHARRLLPENVRDLVLKTER